MPMLSTLRPGTVFRVTDPADGMCQEAVGFVPYDDMGTSYDREVEVIEGGIAFMKELP